MIRKIKFRGLSIDSQYGWVYGYLEIFRHAIGKGKAVIHSFNDWNLNSSTEVKIETIGEYTGLLDKNEKEIYEGDILRQVIETPQGFRYVKGPMYYNTQKAQFGVDMETEDDDPIGDEFSVKESVSGRPEIIGNIHENPELL